MITDAQTWLAKAQALTTGTAYSNAYDNGLARDIGRGTPLRALVLVNTTFTGGTNETVNFVESANADLSSPTVLFGVTPLEAALTAGATVMDVTIPKTTKRYVGFQFVASGTHTTGKLDALIVIDSDSGDAFAANNGF